MTQLHKLVAMALLTVPAGAARAADLTKVPRTIAREPTYQSKPEYCLLVFGPEAAGRVWLVLDGDTLYVDANGNGDLTEAGEKIAPRRLPAEPENRQFKVDALRLGAHIHRDLTIYVTPLNPNRKDADAVALLAKNPKALTYSVSVALQWPGLKGTGAEGRVGMSAGHDPTGILQFADKSAAAPIIHFGGPLEMALTDKPQLMVGREADFRVGVGTPGLGAGSFSFLAEETFPATLHPELKIAFPTRIGHSPLEVYYQLKHRC